MNQKKSPQRDEGRNLSTVYVGEGGEEAACESNEGREQAGH